MGRGRQKAMAKKIARDIKYNTFDPDYGALADELSVGGAESVRTTTFTTEATDLAIDNDAKIQEDEALREYLEWAKETAEKAAANN